MDISESSPPAAKPGSRVDSATHLFANGQAVRLKNAYMSVGNVYLITASLPPTGASPQYRIRNEAESFERMAMESDLELVESAPASRVESAFRQTA